MPSNISLQSVKTHCKHGHEYTPENTLIIRHKTTGTSQRSCKKCQLKRASEWRKRHPEKRSETSKRSSKMWRFANLYHITLEQYEKMWVSQGGVCILPSCGRPIDAIDHCHATGKIRGLMCRQCNSALGFFRDSVQLVREALAYLEAFDG